MSVISLYEEIVVRGNVSPDYFFERMDWHEAMVYVRGMRKKERAEMERVRLLMWAALVPHSKGGLEPEDVLTIPGEDEKPEAEVQAEREEEKKKMEELRKRAKMMEGYV